MYLNTLDIEKKHLFLDLELYMVKADGTFNDKEKAIINSHCLEMHIDNNHFQPETEWDELLSRVSNDLSDLDKRIFLLEIIGVLFADDEYSKEERSFLDVLTAELGISDDDKNTVLKVMAELKACYEACRDFVFEDQSNEY